MESTVRNPDSSGPKRAMSLCPSPQPPPTDRCLHRMHWQAELPAGSDVEAGLGRECSASPLDQPGCFCPERGGPERYRLMTQFGGSDLSSVAAAVDHGLGGDAATEPIERRGEAELRVVIPSGLVRAHCASAPLLELVEAPVHGLAVAVPDSLLVTEVDRSATALVSMGYLILALRNR